MKHSQISRITVLALVAISFTLTLVAQAQDTENVLFDFHHSNGSFPFSLVQDSAGNLYGTTVQGGSSSCAFGCGTVFKLTNTGSGWVGTIVHAFTGGADGNNALGVAVDAQGNLYGTSNQGGAKGSGIVFKISFVSGMPKFTVLHSFPSGPTDGTLPGGIIIGPDGNLYSVTQFGGSTNCGGSGCGTASYGGQHASDCYPYGCGTAFKLTPVSSGWLFSRLTSFVNSSGVNAYTPIVLDSAGNVFGTTYAGGATLANCTSGIGCGVIFELSPPATKRE